MAEQEEKLGAIAPDYVSYTSTSKIREVSPRVEFSFFIFWILHTTGGRGYPVLENLPSRRVDDLLFQICSVHLTPAVYIL
jgi:hypothetical protein